MVPVAPLLPHLRARIDADALGRGGFRSGIAGVTVRLHECTGNQLRSCERLVSPIIRRKLDAVSGPTADALACALGLHPCLIWGPEWWTVDAQSPGSVRGSARSSPRRIPPCVTRGSPCAG